MPLEPNPLTSEVELGGAPPGGLPAQCLTMARTSLIGPPSRIAVGAFGQWTTKNALDIVKARVPVRLRKAFEMLGQSVVTTHVTLLLIVMYSEYNELGK